MEVLGDGFGVDAGFNAGFAAERSEKLLGLAQIGGENDDGSLEGLPARELEMPAPRRAALEAFEASVEPEGGSIGDS